MPSETERMRLDGEEVAGSEIPTRRLDACSSAQAYRISEINSAPHHQGQYINVWQLVPSFSQNNVNQASQGRCQQSAKSRRELNITSAISRL